MYASREEQRRRNIEADIRYIQDVVRLNPEKLQIRSIEYKDGEYRIEFYIITVGSYVKDPRTGEVVLHSTHHVRVDIPSTYPNPMSLKVQILSPILFHPNVDPRGRIDIHKPIKGVLWKLWDIFTFKQIDGDGRSLLNPEAWKWVQRQGGIQQIKLNDTPLQLPSGNAKENMPAETFRVTGRRPGPRQSVNTANRQEETLPTSRSAQQTNEALNPDGTVPANQPTERAMDIDASGEHESVSAPVNRFLWESVQQAAPTPLIAHATSDGFRLKGLRIHKPELWPFPVSTWERSERGYYGSWYYNVPSGYKPGHLKIVLLQNAIEKIFQHSTGDLRNERYGILVGGVFTDPQSGDSWVEIVDMLPAVRVRANLASVEVSNEEISRLNQEVDGILADTGGTVRKLGWYHTHPGHGIFLSGTDQTNQRLCYTADWHVALVVDPVHKRYGAFCGPECRALFDGVLVLSSAAAEKLNTPAHSAWKYVGTKLNGGPPELRTGDSSTPEHEAPLAAIVGPAYYKRQPWDDATWPTETSQPVPGVGVTTYPKTVETVREDFQTNKEGALAVLKKIAGRVLRSVPVPPRSGYWVGMICIALIALLIIAWLSFHLVQVDNSLLQSRTQLQQLQSLLHQIRGRQNDSVLIHQAQKELLAQALDVTADLKDKDPLAYRRILRSIVKLDSTSESGVKARELLTQPITYTVARGDTISQIALNFNVSQSDISKLNPSVKLNVIIPGQMLVIPGEKVQN